MPYSSSHIEGENGCLSAGISAVGGETHYRLVDDTDRPSVNVTPAGKKMDIRMSSPVDTLRLRVISGVKPIKADLAAADEGIGVNILNAARALSLQLSEGASPIKVEVVPAGKRVSVGVSNAAVSLGPQLSEAARCLKVRCSAVCSVGTDENGYEIFMVKEGIFLLFDGKEFSVLKRKW